MKCYYHPQSEAVGICKNCSKGLCQECAVDIGNGIACKDRCETQVKAINEIIHRSETAYKRATEAYTRNAIIYALLGLAFLSFGLIEINTNLVFYLFPVGIICLLGAAFNYHTSKKLANK